MYQETTSPGSEPLIVSEVKDHLRVDHDDDDNYIDGLIKAARQFVEKRTGIACLSVHLLFTWISGLMMM